MVLWSKNQPKKIWPYGSMVEKVKNPTKVKYGTYGSMVEKVKNPTKVKYGTYGSMVEKVENPIRNRKPHCPHKEQSPRFPQTAPRTTTNT